MSYQRSNSYHTASLGNATNFLFGAQFTDNLLDAIEAAGWIPQQELVSKVLVTVLAIVHGTEIILDGNDFVFWWEPNDPPDHGIPVKIEQTDTLEQIVAKFGASVSDNMGSTTNPITTSLSGNTITVEGFPKEKNGHLCSIIPAGFGIWDGATGNAGEGFIWNGGTVYNSAIVGTNPLTVQVRFLSLDGGTRILVRPVSTLNTGTSEQYFNGLQLNAGVFNFAGSDLQFVIYGDFNTAGSIVFVSNLAPIARSINYTHFACGPLRTNVGPEGGARTSFAGFLQHYWVAIRYEDNTGAAYTSSNGAGTLGQDPDICYPGYGRGMTPIDKLPNRIGQNNLELKDEFGNLLPFEPFVAFCNKNPGLHLDAILKIMGQFRDSMIYSKFALPQVSGDIDGDDAEVLVSQTGTSGQSNGVLMVRN